MAKLSGDDNSWRAEGLRKKYQDWEHTKPVDPARPKNKKKKRSAEDMLKCSRSPNGQHKWRQDIGSTDWSTKCRYCAVKKYYHDRAVGKVARKQGRKIQKERQREFCPEGHVWVWQKTSEQQYRDKYGQMPHWLTYNTRRKYELMQQWEKRCAGCDKVDKVRWYPVDEDPPAI